jgi:hypothetical protein
LELGLTGPCAASDVRDRLDAALPSGIDVIEVREMTSGPAAGQLDALGLEASDWEVVLPGVAPADAARAVEVFLAAGTAEVERLTGKGTRRMDARAAVVKLEVDRRAANERDAACVILRMIVRHMTPAVRPDDILTALRQLAGLAPTSPPLVTRLAQGPLGIEAATTPAPAPGPTGTAGIAVPAGTAAQALAQASQPTGWGLGQGQTTRLGAGSAAMADAAPASAYDQLLRGAEGPETDLRAREPDGRLPDARNRATG